MLVPSFRPSQAPWSARCGLEQRSIWYDLEGPLPVYFHRLRSRKFSTIARAGSQRATERWAGQGSAGFRGHGSVGRRAHGYVLKAWTAKTGYWGAVSPPCRSKRAPAAALRPLLLFTNPARPMHIADSPMPLGRDSARCSGVTEPHAARRLCHYLRPCVRRAYAHLAACIIRL